MPRIARIVIPGLPHHVTQRGNNRQDVFLTDADRESYLAVLKKQSSQHGLQVLGYCLMTNHVHIIAVPHRESSLARAVGRTHFVYAQRFNVAHGRSGHLWQGRFYSCAMEEGYEPAAMRYVEQNPVRAGLVGTAWQYPWSSAAAHIGQPDPSGLLDLRAWRKTTAGIDWESFLAERTPSEELANLHRQTMTGRPLGTDAFLDKLARRIGPEVKANPIGRPRK